MENCILDEIKLAKNLIEKKCIKGAIDILKPLAKKYPEDGCVAFNLGRCAALLNEPVIAYHYYSLALEKGYKDIILYLILADYESFYGSIKQAEIYFNDALVISNSNEEKWAVLNDIALFYITHNMYLNADRYIKRLINDFPDNYNGYHLHFLIYIIKEKYDDARKYLEMLPIKFKNLPQYLIDFIDVIKLQGNTNELLELFENDRRLTDIIPQYVFKQKYILSNDNTEKIGIVNELIKEYHDKDSVLSLVFLYFAQQKFQESSEIAKFVLEQEKDIQGIRFYLALYFQIFNLFYLANKKPSADLRKWIETAGNWCLNYVNKTNIKEIQDSVSDSIASLFKEINSSVN